MTEELIQQTKEEIIEEMKKHKLQVIENILEQFGFYIGNNDGEFFEKNYEKVKEELYEAIEDEKPDDVYHYIKDYLIKNYPYHGEYKGNS